VKEYFLFDPKEEYLKPSFQGFRRVRDEFRPIKFASGRLPSKVLGLHLERVGDELRLWNPATGERLPTPSELAVLEAERANAEVERTKAEAQRARAEAERARAEAERANSAEAEVERLRRELEQLRGKPNGK
jgi:hypothetical protein